MSSVFETSESTMKTCVSRGFEGDCAQQRFGLYGYYDCMKKTSQHPDDSYEAFC